MFPSIASVTMSWPNGNKPLMKKYLRFLLVLLILLCCVGCDQAVKAIARGALASSPPVLFLDGAVRLQYTENPGAFLSLGAELPAGVRYLFGVVLVGATQLALFAFLMRTRSLTTAQRIGFSLFLAGGLTPANVARAVQQVRPYAVDVAGGVEASPGIKDPVKVKEFVAHAKSA